ncbi:electron transport complex subunit E [Motiliproteus sp. MSK22-1]|uniref:electron transport complex subunit E n=1 Tax=Motiliproteus sp. MSK22-1 TaxID=1897630 RepID=UPI00097813FB|nr:electron transport complex subunit E [Motiliproteus sp. MSK22-1]OMH33849.1 electron transport complex subunit RsxE [Motiliproteus sp. MSK22-1]
MIPSYRQIIADGLWHNNVVFAQLLALCPLLAVTSTATNGLGMGLASTVVLTGSNLLVSSFRRWLIPEVRIPVFILIISTLVTLVDLVMNAWIHELHKVLGLFIPLIVTNCAILGRAEAFASRQPVLPAIADGLMMGAGMTMALVLLGACREILGSGTLFAQAGLLLGGSFSVMELVLWQDYSGVLLMLLPPGGFLVMGFLIAGKRLVERSASRSRQALSAKTIDPTIDN